MKSAVLEKPAATGALDADRLRALVLVRIASAADGTEQDRRSPPIWLRSPRIALPPRAMARAASSARSRRSPTPAW